MEDIITSFLLASGFYYYLELAISGKHKKSNFAYIAYTVLFLCHSIGRLFFDWEYYSGIGILILIFAISYMEYKDKSINTYSKWNRISAIIAIIAIFFIQSKITTK